MNNGQAYAKALLDLSKENNIDINQIVSELQLVNSYFDDEFISFLKELHELKEEYRESILPDKNIEEAKIVKYADKISAYIKCLEELKQGNSEFKKAESTIKKAIKEYDSEEVNYFMDNFVGAYKLTLDELD